MWLSLKKTGEVFFMPAAVLQWDCHCIGPCSFCCNSVEPATTAQAFIMEMRRGSQHVQPLALECETTVTTLNGSVTDLLEMPASSGGSLYVLRCAGTKLGQISLWTISQTKEG